MPEALINLMFSGNIRMINDMNSSPPHRPRISITLALISILLCTTVVIQIFASMYFYKWQRTSQYQSLTDNLQQISDQASRNLVTPLWNFDFDHIHQIAENFMLLPDLMSIRIVDASGKILVDQHKDFSVLQEHHSVGSNEHVYHKEQAIRKNNELIGSVQIALTSYHTEERLDRYQTSIILTIVIVALVQISTLFFLLKNTVIRPIQTLRDFTSQVRNSQHQLTLSTDTVHVRELYDLKESILCMVADILNSEKKYRSIFENSLEGIFQISPAGKFISLNQAMATILGYSCPEEILLGDISMDHHIFLDHTQFRDLFTSAIRHGSISQREVILRHQDGNLLHCLISVRTTDETVNTFTSCDGSLIDITLRKKAEENLAILNQGLEKQVIKRTEELNLRNAELQASQERYRNLVETMQEGILLIDKDDRVLYTNPKMSQLLGVGANELIGTHCLRFLHDQNREVFKDHIQNTSKNQNMKFEVSFSRSDGQVISTLVTPTTTYDERGNYTGAFAVVTDITDLKKLQLQLMQSQKLESIGQLAAGIAHEINTPTQYIISNIEFLQDVTNELIDFKKSYDQLITSLKEQASMDTASQGSVACYSEKRLNDDLIPEISSAFRDIFEGLGQIALIVSSVKKFARPGEEGMREADINEIISNAILLSSNEWKYVADMETDLESNLPSILCNPSAMSQVFINLILNAAHAINDKNAPQKGTIRITSVNTSENIEIYISDTGNGIAESIRSKIFDPFFTTREVGKGRGQGLAVARSIVVESHHGNIDFTSEGTTGTTFIIQLPKTRPALN